MMATAAMSSHSRVGRGLAARVVIAVAMSAVTPPAATARAHGARLVPWDPPVLTGLLAVIGC